MRARVVVAAVFAALVVLYDIPSLVLLLITALASPSSDRLPSGVAVGYSAGPFPWGVLVVQKGWAWWRWLFGLRLPAPLVEAV